MHWKTAVQTAQTNASNEKSSSGKEVEKTICMAASSETAAWRFSSAMRRTNMELSAIREQMQLHAVAAEKPSRRAPLWRRDEPTSLNLPSSQLSAIGTKPSQPCFTPARFAIRRRAMPYIM